jgi:hypothetical protein
VDRVDAQYRDLHIENVLTDEHGYDVKLKKGAHVQVTVTAEPKMSIAIDNDGSRSTRRKTAGLGFGRHNPQGPHRRFEICRLERAREEREIRIAADAMLAVARMEILRRAKDRVVQGLRKRQLGCRTPNRFAAISRGTQ